MNRRQALKSIALSTGVVISPGIFVGTLQAAAKSTRQDWLPVFLASEELIAVSQVADVIIPASETPGALDVAVPQFIDLLLKDVFTSAESDKFRKGLKVFLQRFEQDHNAVFQASSPQQRQAYVEQLYTLSKDDTEKVLSLVKEEVAPSGMENEYYLWSFLVTQRELTINSYFTSEKIGEQVLSYDPVPGRYDPCLPVEKVGNVWSL